ncbi:smr domain-containing protein [Morchella snyderi]|nr:smr domain-containing protein [Morchella snyderi]
MASFLMNQINPQADSPHHGGATDADEAEYDRLRGLAREEGQKRGRCFDRSRAAYEAGDGAAAHELSEEGKRHGAQMEAYNAQARDFIFRANNAHQPEDTIDLHGLYVEEAEEILETRLRAARQRGDDHIHVIVGKGNHSAGGVTKIKPAVEKLLRAQGLQFNSEQNEGRILVQLREGGGAGQGSGGYGGHQQQQQQQNYQQGGRYQKHQQQQQQQQQQHHQQQQQHQHQQQQYPQNHQQQQEQGQGQQQPANELEELAKKAAPMFFKKLQGCCIIV